MGVTVSLKDLVDHLHLVGDETSAFLNKTTGELIVLSVEEFKAAEGCEDLRAYAVWQRELIGKARRVLDSEDFLELPTKFDLHEYRIMEAFCRAVHPPALRERLLREIRGGGALSRFRRSVQSSGVEPHWRRYRDKEYERVVVEWLGANGIAHRRDTGGDGRRT